MTPQPAIQIGVFFPVAVNAEPHLESSSLHPVHDGHFSVALGAFQLFPDMTLVVEKHMFGNIIHLNPGDGGFGVEIFMFLFNFRMVGNNMIMAVQAFFHRRNSRMNGTGHIGMAEFAGDILYTRVDPVTEGNGLLRTHAQPGKLVKEKKKQPPQKTAGKDHENQAQVLCFQRAPKGHMGEPAFHDPISL
jgi:hypothetical protein